MKLKFFGYDSLCIKVEIYYNSRDHRFSSSGLRKQVKQIEDN